MSKYMYMGKPFANKLHMSGAAFSVAQERLRQALLQLRLATEDMKIVRDFLGESAFRGVHEELILTARESLSAIKDDIGKAVSAELKHKMIDRRMERLSKRESKARDNADGKDIP